MKGAEWNACDGEAHSNCFIDNCMQCAPHWGVYPICPVDKCRLKSGKIGKCPRCNRRFSLVRAERPVRYCCRTDEI